MQTPSPLYAVLILAALVAVYELGPRSIASEYESNQAARFKAQYNDFLYPGCTACCIGYQSPGLCNRCGLGWYANTPNATGYPTSLNGPGTACWPCPPGAVSYGNDDCSLCSGGTYSNSPASTSCTKCPSNTVSADIGATSESTCQTCPAGSFPNSLQTACTSCGGAISGCTSCSNSSAIAVCLTCAEGFALQNGACTACNNGNYLASLGATSCTACPVGTFSDASQQGYSQCIACPTGSGPYSGIKSSIKYCGVPSCDVIPAGKPAQCAVANAPYYVLSGVLSEACTAAQPGCLECSATGSTNKAFTCSACTPNSGLVLQPISPPIVTLVGNPLICAAENCTALNRTTGASSAACGACLAGYTAVPTLTGLDFICA